MAFLWPQAFGLLVLVPLGVLLLRVLGRRQRRRVLALAGIAGLQAPAEGRRARTRIPAALVLLGMLALVVALARPEGVLAVPREEGTVILAFDVSASMAATDLAPSRIAAARAAATDFVQRQPPSVVVGVVAFNDAGALVQAPTNDGSSVLAALQRLVPQSGTSLARGIAASLAAIAAEAAGPVTNYYSSASPAPTPTPTPVPAGTHAPAVIVLLSDGENNESPDPLAAAQQAAARGVRIFTVGIGSPAGTTLDLGGFRVHTQLDAAMLQQIAQITGGSYYSATNAPSLRSVYEQLDTQLVVRPELLELTAVFAGIGLLLLMAGTLASLGLQGRLP